MTDLTTYVPDTSKYTDPADRLIALGLAMKSGAKIQCSANRGSSWAKAADHGTHETNVLVRSRGIRDGLDYRAKPEPRVVWVNFDRDGTAFYYNDESAAKNVAHSIRKHSPCIIATAVRVELPE